MPAAAVPRHHESQPSVPKGTACRSELLAKSIAAQKNDEAATGSPRRPVWAASDRSHHAGTSSVSLARVEDGTRRTARDQDAHAESYGSLSKILQRLRAGGGAFVRFDITTHGAFLKVVISSNA